MNLTQPFLDLIFQDLVKADTLSLIKKLHSADPTSFSNYLNQEDSEGFPNWFSFLNKDLPENKKYLKDLVLTLKEAGVDFEKPLTGGPAWVVLIKDKRTVFGGRLQKLDELFKDIILEGLNNSSVKDLRTSGILSVLTKNFASKSIKSLIQKGFNPDKSEVNQSIKSLQKSTNLFVAEKQKRMEILGELNKLGAENVYQSIQKVLKEDYEEFSGQQSAEFKNQILEHFNSFSNQEKTALLKEALNQYDLSLANSLLKEMGVPLSTKAGFLKILPLIDSPRNKKIAQKMLVFNVFQRDVIESEFGKITPWEAFSRATNQSLYLREKSSRVKNDQTILDLIEEDLPQLRQIAFFQEDRIAWLEFLCSNDFLRKERLGISKEDDSRFSGLFNEIAKRIVPQNDEISKAENVYHFFEQNKELMRKLAPLVLFDINESGEEIVSPVFFKEFWTGSKASWIAWPGIFEKVLSTQQLSKVFCSMIPTTGDIGVKDYRSNILERNNIESVVKVWNLLQERTDGDNHFLTSINVDRLKKAIQNAWVSENASFDHASKQIFLNWIQERLEPAVEKEILLALGSAGKTNNKKPKNKI